jgi:hypothetical protein
MYVGEWGIDPFNFKRQMTTAEVKSSISSQLSYMRSHSAVGHAFFAWGELEGRGYADAEVGWFTQEETDYILDNIFTPMHEPVNTDPSVDWIRVRIRSSGDSRIDPGGSVDQGIKIRLYARVSDAETDSSELTVRMFYRRQGGSWTEIAPVYHVTYDYWYYNWDIPGDAVPGLYDVKVDVEDPSGGSAMLTEMGEFSVE